MGLFKSIAGFVDSATEVVSDVACNVGDYAKETASEVADAVGDLAESMKGDKKEEDEGEE